MKNVILDTDLGNDCDDVGALVLLTNLAKQKLCTLSAVISCSGKPNAPTLARGILVERGQEARVGRQFNGFDEITDHYCSKTAEHFSMPNEIGEDSLKLYRSLLSDSAKHTVIAIGALNGISDFITSKKNGISGAELFNKNVEALYVMGGNFTNQAPEWNIQMDILSARNVIKQLTVPVYFMPFEAGENVLTGANLSGIARYVYDSFSKNTGTRHSWDPLTVFCAFFDELTLVEKGTVTILDNGITEFSKNGGNHGVIKLKHTKEETAKILNKYMN